MTSPPSSRETSQETSRVTGPPRAVVVAGMACAAVLGVGLGLWARPTAEPEPGAPSAAAAEPAPQALQIVVDDRPAPIGEPLVVLPPAQPSAPGPAPVTRVLKVADAADSPAPAPPPAASRPEPARPHVAVRKAVEPKPAKLRPARPKVVTAKTEPSPAKAAKAAPVRLAKAEAPAAKSRKAAHKPAARQAAVQVAQAKPRKAPKAHARPVEVAKARSAPRPVARGEAPRRVAAADRCALPDRAEAMVCADRRLSARDRQLRRAYQAAEAAGVPEAALRRQQVRWLAARAAAAREAPWAVEDVYVARIAELNDLAADAREN